MPGIFDRLQKKIEIQQKADGITSMDMAELSPSLRRIVKLLLREPMDYPHLYVAMNELPLDERLSPENFSQALDTLTKQFWLRRIGTGECAIYKVNLRRRSGTSLPAGIWGTLDTKLKHKPE